MKTKIKDLKLGINSPLYVVAEIGFNHGGDKELAIRLIEGAAEAGANAVKFQTFKAKNLVLENEDHFKIIQNTELNFEDYIELFKIAKSNNLDFFSTPFDNESVDILERLGVEFYKIASMDITNIPLLKYVSKTKKPIILSTGMALLSEISEAIEFLRNHGTKDIILLHCISKYPTPIEETNLININYLKNTFSLPTGFSDHTIGYIAPLTAGIMGACMIEKHFTIDKSLPGPDHRLSCNVEELKQLICDLRRARQCIGETISLKRSDMSNAKIFRRGIYANQFIPKGTKLKKEMLKLVRPEQKLSPKYIDTVINRITTKDINIEEAISFENF